MMALLRADAYRVLHSRWPWVIAGVAALLTLAPALLMRWAAVGPTVYDGLTVSALSLNGCAVLVGIMAAIATCDKASLSFDRTALSSLGARARRTWFAEKCAFAVLLSGATLLCALALGLLGLLVSGVPVLNPEPAWQVAVWLGCAWLGCSTYAVLTVLVGQLARNDNVAGAFAAFAASGMLEGAAVLGIDVLCYFVGGTFLNLSEAILPWLPAGALSAVSAGAGALLTPDGAGLVPAARELIVCVPVIAATVAASAFLASRRDVA